MTIEEIKALDLEGIENRSGEIAKEIEVEGADLETLNAEMDALEERKAALIEERNNKLNAIADGEGKITEKMEERKMEKNFNIESVEYRDAWLKRLMGRELDEMEKRAMTADAAIPTITLNKIVMIINENPLLGRIDMMNIPGYVRIPIYSNDNAASWTTTSTDSADALTYIDLTPYQLIKTVEVPATVDKMSITAFEAYLVEKLADNIKTALQTAVLVGTGSSQATGIITTKSTKDGEFTKAAVTKKDLLTIMGALGAAYQKDAVWIMPAEVFYSEVMNISTHDSFVNVNDGFTYKLFGHDVILDDNCTVSNTDNILYGQPKAYHMNMGEDVKVDKDASVAFRSNSVVYRAVCLADGKLDSANAFVRYERAAS